MFGDLLLACGLALVAVPLGAQADQHPDRRYITPMAGVPATTISFGARPEPGRLRLARTAIAAFGSEADPEDLLLGDILAARLLPAGGVVVLDPKLFHLRFFDAAARPVATVSRQGQGPGEVARRATGIALDLNGDVLLTDLGRALKRFTRGPRGWTYAGQVPLDGSPEALCLLGDRVALNTPDPARPEAVEVRNAAGRVLARFGSVYASPSPIVNYSFNHLRLACDPSTGTVFAASSGALGEVRAYAGDGTPRWRATITGLTGFLVTAIDQGYSVEEPRNATAVESVVGLTLLPGRGLLVQVAQTTFPDLRAGAWFTQLHSFLFDPSTGRGVALGTALPRVADADSTRALVIYEDPVPRFEIRTILDR